MIAQFVKFALCLLCAVGVVHAVPIGETALVIGQSQLQRAQAALPIIRGMPLEAGDTLQTSANGHVHIRFRDGAFVSVRPNSRLIIEAYQFDPQSPQKSAIKFRLEQGVMRSITGRWGEAARERFRLNTPLAAIGVRGTDFTVQASADQLRTTVNTGAIVVTPLGEDCQAETIAPCATGKTQLLAADMGQWMLELTRREGKVRLVPFNDVSPSERLSPTTQEESRQRSLLHPEPASETRAAQSVLRPATPNYTPAQLAWGHWWGEGDGGIIQSYAQASQGRTGVVGNLNYGLFRQRVADSDMPFNGGVLSFQFNGASVAWVQNGISSPAQVYGGGLTVDFNRQQFFTDLTLAHTQTGIVNWQIQGSVQANGGFQGKNETGMAAGAVSFNNKEAGYLFEHNVGSGQFTGVTLWKR